MKRENFLILLAQFCHFTRQDQSRTEKKKIRYLIQVLYTEKKVILSCNET